MILLGRKMVCINLADVHMRPLLKIVVQSRPVSYIALLVRAGT
jgi:hypothetical protein